MLISYLKVIFFLGLMICRNSVKSAWPFLGLMMKLTWKVFPHKHLHRQPPTSLKMGLVRKLLKGKVAMVETWRRKSGLMFLQLSSSPVPSQCVLVKECQRIFSPMLCSHLSHLSHCLAKFLENLIMNMRREGRYRKKIKKINRLPRL